MNDAYSSSAQDEELVEADVLYTEGTGQDTIAVLKPGGAETHRVPAAKITQETGFAVEQLPGLRLIAVVRGGQLAEFRREA